MVVEAHKEEIKIVEIDTSFVPNLWELVRARIASACERSGGRYDVKDILAFLLDGKMKLWLAMEGHFIDAIAITEIVIFPQLKECRILVTTGEQADKWTHLIEKIEAWAQLMGCKKMMAITRPGWERPLKKYGYEKGHIQLEKDLEYVH